jgi:hypothetical protein
MTLTTGDNEADRDAGGEPMEMRQGPNYGPPPSPSNRWPEGGPPAGAGDPQRSMNRKDSSRLLLILGALLIAIAIIVLLLSLR